MTRALWMLLICGCLIGYSPLAFGQASALFVDPSPSPSCRWFWIWPRGLRICTGLQNLAWGIGQPLLVRWLIVTALASARRRRCAVHAGPGTHDGLIRFRVFQPIHRILIGLGMSGAGHNIVLAAFGQLMPPERRAWAMACASPQQASVSSSWCHLAKGSSRLCWSTAILIMAVAMPPRRLWHWLCGRGRRAWCKLPRSLPATTHQQAHHDHHLHRTQPSRCDHPGLCHNSYCCSWLASLCAAFMWPS